LVVLVFYLFLFCYLFFTSLFKKGTRSSLRWKVNDSLISGICLVECFLPIGRGQRQLILGDRSIGKTSIFLTLVIVNGIFNYIGSIDGLGSKRLFAIYIGINQNLSKISKLINSLIMSWLFIILVTHSSSGALLSYLIPFCGISIAERLRDRGFDTVICFDDSSQHAKSYRQISLILAKIPSRDAFPADISNIHSSLLERCGKLKYGIKGGSITGFPVIETINSDISDYIATNIISITDGQFYLDKKLFLDSIRPAFDSGLSVSRIGSAAQSKWIKTVSGGIKNTLTYLRKETQLNAELRLLTLLNSLNIIFNSKHLSPQPIEYSIILIFAFKTSIIFSSFISRLRLEFLLIFDLIYSYYLVIISKSSFNLFIYFFVSFFLTKIFDFSSNMQYNMFAN
jgi:proton translocating ATP synthase F1 alpha subunit